MDHLLLAFLLHPGGPCDSVPSPVNQAVLAFVQGHAGQRVGRGECGDLVAEAMDAAGARWDGEQDLGDAVNPLKDRMHAGDVIHFSNTTFRHFKGGLMRTERTDDHTAVIIRVQDRGTCTLAHRNTPSTGKKVGSGDIDLRHIVSGNHVVYRPRP
jgi:hypothetical protein